LTAEVEIQNSFLALLDQQPLLNLNFGRGSIFWRGRKSVSADGYSNISELFYPKVNFAKIGRLNEQGEPMLYLASRKFTVLTEINAQPGDYVHIIGYRIRRNQATKIGLIGDLFHVYRTGLSMILPEVGETLKNHVLSSFEYEIGRSIIYVDAYLASVLRNPNAASYNYLYTRILGKLLFNKIDEVKSIFYPSVVQEGGMNLAMTPAIADDVLEVVSSSIISVLDKLEFGMYEFAYTKNCVDIRNDGSFIWEPAAHPRESILLQ
jgi:hypothetical protein